MKSTDISSTLGLLIGLGMIVGGALQIAFWRSSGAEPVVTASRLPPKFFDIIGVIFIMVGLMVALGSLGGG